jgi:hypothetical protein
MPRWRLALADYYLAKAGEARGATAAEWRRTSLVHQLAAGMIRAAAVS